MIQIIVLLMIIYLFALGVLDINADECNDSRKNGKCCVNYFFNENNKTCDPCPLGTFGSYCSANCPRGYYGLFCNEKCNCKTGIHCSPTTGCDNASNHTTTIRKTGINNNLPSHVSFVIVVSSLICVGVCISFYFRLRKPVMAQISFDANSSAHNRRQRATVTDVAYALRRFQKISNRTDGIQDSIGRTEGIYNEILTTEMENSMGNTEMIYHEISTTEMENQ